MPMFSPAGMSLGLNNLPGLGSTLAGQRARTELYRRGQCRGNHVRPAE